MKRHWDLMLIILLSLLLIAIIYISPENSLRKVIGIGFILFFPGYAFINFLFPKKKELDTLERLALSFGLSIAITPLIGLVLNYTPYGIRLTPILISLGAFNIVFSTLAIYRRENVKEPYIPKIDIEKLKEELEWDKISKLDKILTVVLVIAIISSFATLIYIITHPKQSEYFTEFYILGKSGKAYDYPTKLFVGENGTVIIGIVNHEGREVNYFVEIWLVNLTYNTTTNQTTIHNMYLMDKFNISLLPKPIVVEGNWTPQWEKNYTFTIDKPGKWQLWFLLFKDKEPKLPKPANNDYAKTNATQRILDAIDGKILSLKLNVDVGEI
ncbi:DUF1616 domain-containing protein [Methanotorris formicicus]|nr:DUF1616 domain-containing protein [Methanotorris formicicus]